MNDTEKMLTKLRQALVEVFEQDIKIIRTDGGENRLGIAMANLERALAAFTAEMPGAIGVCVDYARWGCAEEVASTDPCPLDDEIRAALADLEEK